LPTGHFTGLPLEHSVPGMHMMHALGVAEAFVFRNANKPIAITSLLKSFMFSPQ
jgi:hypothetical protein